MLKLFNSQILISSGQYRGRSKPDVRRDPAARVLRIIAEIVPNALGSLGTCPSWLLCSFLMQVYLGIYIQYACCRAEESLDRKLKRAV